MRGHYEGTIKNAEHNEGKYVQEKFLNFRF
jgi:hypothetical protein